MGATVTTGKLASAFKGTDGKTVFVLFEETYESNCYPHTPRWSCLFFGPIEKAVRRIFARGAACEGGMLQNRNGQITPEGYIAGWMKELANPVEFHDRDISLKVERDFYATIPESKAADVFKRLTELGRQDIVTELAEGRRFSVSLYRESELLEEVYGSGLLPPWRLIASKWVPKYEQRRPDHGYTPEVVASKATEGDVPAFLKVDGDNRLVKGTDGKWRCDGWEFAIIAGFVSSLWEVELRNPGSYRKRIKEFRQAISTAPTIPEGTKVVIDPNATFEHDSQRESVERCLAEIPWEKTASGYEILVSTDAGLRRELTTLPDGCAIWVLPAQSEQRTEGQLSLFAA